MKTRYYVLREKATGLLFPAGKGNVSYTEFCDDLPPRLYKRAQDALYTARHWCMGHVWIPRSRQHDEFADPFDYDVKPVEGRSIEKLEVVPVELVLK